MAIYQQKVEQKVKIFDKYNQGDTENYCPLLQFSSTCCAMSRLSAKNFHTLDEIREMVEHIKKDSNSRVFKPSERNWGERNLVCIISPGENKLEKNLKELKFKCLTNSMRRRRGYPKPDYLKLYMLTF